MVNKDNLKEKYMEYQLLMQQLQQLQQNVSALEKHVMDLRVLEESVNSIGEAQLNSETLMPLGSGIFVRGELKDNKMVVTNVGNGVCVEKSIDGAKQTIGQQLEEVSNVLVQLQDEINNTTSRLQELQSAFQNVREEELEGIE